eukprot:3698792-Pleurochrysis_carterae.AAC.5
MDLSLPLCTVGQVLGASSLLLFHTRVACLPCALRWQPCARTPAARHLGDAQAVPELEPCASVPTRPRVAAACRTAVCSTCTAASSSLMHASSHASLSPQTYCDSASESEYVLLIHPDPLPSSLNCASGLKLLQQIYRVESEHEVLLETDARSFYAKLLEPSQVNARFHARSHRRLAFS